VMCGGTFESGFYAGTSPVLEVVRVNLLFCRGADQGAIRPGALQF
jgi:hypothetical protein